MIAAPTFHSASALRTRPRQRLERETVGAGRGGGWQRQHWKRASGGGSEELQKFPSRAGAERGKAPVLELSGAPPGAGIEAESGEGGAHGTADTLRRARVAL